LGKLIRISARRRQLGSIDLTVPLVTTA
jgi:hypothetical protein